MATKAKQSSTFLVPDTGPELVVGLVAPIGTDLSIVENVLREEFEKVGYESECLHVSKLMKDSKIELKLKESPLETRYKTYMDAGNKIRRKMRRNDALALLSIAAIKKRRGQITGKMTKPSPKTVYIFNQLKRPEEVEKLRDVYGKLFIQVSAYCSSASRLNSLTHKISESHHGDKRSEHYKSYAQNLIVRDDDEEQNEYGQRVKNTFPLADVIISAENENSTRETCRRFIRAFFGDSFITPRKEEYGAYTAKCASLRSSDLSRQVGAAAVTKQGEIIALGCNEVPKGGGGTYWEEDETDSRDFVHGFDPAHKMKRHLLEDIFRILNEGKWLRDDVASKGMTEMVRLALDKRSNPHIEDANIMNSLEYGRIIHAEMSVIADCARRGISLRESILYTTTYPCHNCARHIVASGISEVVFLEPYSKSLAGELHNDSIHFDDGRPGTRNQVVFRQFIGIAPERYWEIFKRGKRKDESGIAKKWQPAKATPIVKQFVASYIPIESAVVKTTEEILKPLQTET
ncbi:MAG: anti-phage dCTP deaminase [Rhodovibrionaceae bacterium]